TDQSRPAATRRRGRPRSKPPAVRRRPTDGRPPPDCASRTPPRAPAGRRGTGLAGADPRGVGYVTAGRSCPPTTACPACGRVTSPPPLSIRLFLPTVNTLRPEKLFRFRRFAGRPPLGQGEVASFLIVVEPAKMSEIPAVRFRENVAKIVPDRTTISAASILVS